MAKRLCYPRRMGLPASVARIYFLYGPAGGHRITSVRELAEATGATERTIRDHLPEWKRELREQLGGGREAGGERPGGRGPQAGLRAAAGRGGPAGRDDEGAGGDRRGVREGAAVLRDGAEAVGGDVRGDGDDGGRGAALKEMARVNARKAREEAEPVRVSGSELSPEQLAVFGPA